MMCSATWCVLVAAISLAAIEPVAAQTLEPPAIAKTDTLDNALEIQPRVAVLPDSTAKIDAATEIEIQRRFNELRNKLLDDRAESITWWLAIVAVLFTLWGLVIAIGGLIGYREFRALRDEARRIVEEIKGDKKRIDELLDEDKIGQGFGDPDRAARTAAEIQQDAGESQLDADSAYAYYLQMESKIDPALDADIAYANYLQMEGNIEEAIEKWRSIANDAEVIDSELAARAWRTVSDLLREKGEKEAE